MLKVVGASWFQTRVGACIVGAVVAIGVVAVILGEIDNEQNDGVYSATVFWREKVGFHIDFWGQGNELQEIPHGVGRAYYKQDIDKTGWAVLEIETQPEYPDWVQAYAAGLLEGSLSWQLIHWHWRNSIVDVCRDCEDFCNQVRKLVEQNSQFIKDTAEKRGDKDPFWHQVYLFYVQLDGLEMGWRRGVERNLKEIDIPHADFLLMNIVSDMPDLEHYYNNTVEGLKVPFIFTAASRFASAFVKYHQDTGELFAVHSSGGLYQSMLRVLKRYQFGYHMTHSRTSDLVPGQTVSFSSYPGVVHSQDDFYLVTGDPEFGKKQHQLAILGTALSTQNRTSTTRFQIEEQVLIGARVMAANRISQNSRFWGRYLTHANSGTGNKQWLIVDYGQIAKTEWIPVTNDTTNDTTRLPVSTERTATSLSSSPISIPAYHQPMKARKGLLWVVEQLPEYMNSADQTHALMQRGFWISNGIPSYKNKSQRSGQLAVQEDNSHYIQQNFTDITSLIQLMRNDSILKKDSLLSKPKKFHGIPDIPTPMGTIDTKVFYASPFQNVDLYVSSSAFNPYVNNKQNSKPTQNETVETSFQWSISKFANETHIGIPDMLHFDVIQPKWVWF